MAVALKTLQALGRYENMLKSIFSHRRTWFFIAILIVVLDQVSKILVSTHFDSSSKINLISDFGFGFDLVLRHNTGAAFNFLAYASGWQRWFFIGLALSISTVIVIWLWRVSQAQKLESLALALILGGAIGNVCDRIFYGHVIDFILLYYKDWQYPAFNIADTAIFIGAVLLALGIFKDKKSVPTVI